MLVNECFETESTVRAIAIDNICDGEVGLIMLRTLRSIMHATTAASREPVISIKRDQVNEEIIMQQMIGNAKVSTVQEFAPLISVVMPAHAKENQWYITLSPSALMSAFLPHLLIENDRDSKNTLSFEIIHHKVLNFRRRIEIGMAIKNEVNIKICPVGNSAVPVLCIARLIKR